MKVKRNATLIAIALLAMASIQTACAQKRSISKTYNVGNFSAIEVDIVGNIVFTQSNEIKVTAEGEEDMVNALIVKVEKGELILDKKESLKKKLFGNRKSKKLNVYISAPDINRIELDGVGNFTLKGNVKLDNLEVESDGVINFEALQLTCRRLRVDSDGVGNTRLKGSAQLAEYKSDGVGNIHAQDFIAQDAVVNSSGVGNVKCYAAKTIDLQGSGVGSITYYGKPSVTGLNKSGVGGIKSGD